MPLLVRNISVPVAAGEEGILRELARVLHTPARYIRGFGVVRRSLDARDHRDIRLIYHVECKVDGNEEQIVKRGRPGQITLLKREPPVEVASGTAPLRHRPVIVGTGPAGLFAAWLLAERGYMPIVLERGQDVPQRHRALHLYYTEGRFDPENNLLFGIGGAGAYSDGKLYSRTHDTRNASVLETLYRFGGDPEICIDAKPHLGSDKLPGICRRMVDRIRECGGEVRYGAKIVDLDVAEGSPRTLRALILESGERLETDHCILAIGHSARDTYRVLHGRGVALAAKPFQMGVRIEHPQAMINANQYGPMCGSLPPADYTLVAKGAAGASPLSGPDLFSFCMCPGGTILPSNESANEICTNGASNSRRGSAFANSGLVVTIMPAEFNDDPLAGIEYQRRWEALAYQLSGSYAVPAQRATDYLKGRTSDGKLDCSFPLGAKAVDLRAMLPKIVSGALEKGLPLLDRMIRGYASNQGIITGPETRASSPVRIVRDQQTRQSTTVAGLYPVGEGAGYAGGIVSSAADGMASAEEIVRTCKPMK